VRRAAKRKTLRVINSKIWAASLETGANDVKDMDLVSGANPELRNEP
jgi:hypothetical protein